MKTRVWVCVLLMSGCDLPLLPSSTGSGGDGRAADRQWVDAPTPQTPEQAKPGSVIVREQDAEGTYRGVRVRCAAGTERLVGGGCHGVTSMRGRPYGHGPTDTLGAGWECSYDPGSLRGLETSAYALCQVVR